MNIFKLLVVMFIFINTSFSKEIQLFTNQNDEGGFNPLTKKATSYFANPSSSKITKLKVKVRKIKGKKFRVIITGNLLTKISERSQDTVMLDVYDEEGWLRSDKVTGKGFSAQITFVDRDLISTNDDITGGFQTINLPYIGKGKGALGQTGLYQGNFKLMYEVSFADIKMQLGSGDTPELYVRVTIPERIGDSSKDSTPEEVKLTDDGEEDNEDNETKFWKDVKLD